MLLSPRGRSTIKGVLHMKMQQITPMIPCSQLATQISFYRQCLGFDLEFKSEAYAIMRRDRAAIRLMQVDGQVDLSHPERQGSFYIDVLGIDNLYKILQPKLDTLENIRVRAPFDQEYGQREFHVADEDCTLVLFGEAIF